MATATASATTTAAEVARYFLWRANSEGKRLTNKKLQKLLYYAQAWHLALDDSPLFDDDIEAWIHGPVVPSVYREYKRYGFSPLPCTTLREETENVPERELLDEIWNVYGKYDADYLEALTHSETPWQDARGDLEAHEWSIAVISQDAMRDYYRPLAATE